MAQLENAMKRKGYLVYVEKHSAAQNVLENSTGIFNRIFERMKSQPATGNTMEKPYEVKSVEDGIALILTYGSRAIFGGSSTLFYNMKVYGTQNFQMSDQLYTRYSAIAVQQGCPFLDSLNAM